MFARLTALLVLGTFACRGEPVAPAIDRVNVHAAAARPSSAAAQPVSPSAQAKPETAPAPEPRPWPPASTGATSDFCIDGVGVLDALARELIADLADKRQKLEALTSQHFTRLYLAGSSSGAYFVVALALSGDLPAHGFAAISGGAVRPGHDFTGLTPAPFYVGYGTLDTVSTASRSLAAQLRREGWPVLLSAHPLPHGAAEIYLDEAFMFFRFPADAER